MESSEESSASPAFLSPATSTSSSQESDSHSGVTFIKHNVSKLDTLAGLAIKYNVSVGDIKRANGLFSDSAMYARSSILIPTGHLPIGEELQKICAQVLSGVSRDPVLHADSQFQPASAALARIATSLNVVNGDSYPEDVPFSESAWLAMCQCGGCGPMDPAGLCPRIQQPVEVELTDRSSEGTYLPPASAGPTRQHDAVRRRRNQNDDAESCTDSANSFGWGNASRGPGFDLPVSRSFAARAEAFAGDNGALSAWFAELGKAIGEGVSSTVAKVKEAANQPVLAVGSGSTGGFGAAAADALVASRRKVSSTWLGRAPFEGGGGGGVGSMSGPSPQLASVPAKTKQGGKLD